MNPDLIESKIKILKANIKILEKEFNKIQDVKSKNKLEQETNELEKLKDLYPAFFI